MILQSEDEEEVAGHIDLAERIQVTIFCLVRFIQDLFGFQIFSNQVENFLPYLTGKKQLTPRARDLTFCNWATNKVKLLNPQIFRLKKYLRLSSG